jgi:hypothetical protein
MFGFYLVYFPLPLWAVLSSFLSSPIVTPFTNRIIHTVWDAAKSWNEKMEVWVFFVWRKKNFVDKQIKIQTETACKLKAPTDSQHCFKAKHVFHCAFACFEWLSAPLYFALRHVVFRFVFLASVSATQNKTRKTRKTTRCFKACFLLTVWHPLKIPLTWQLEFNVCTPHWLFGRPG